jgi:hypothetical protein
VDATTLTSAPLVLLQPTEPTPIPPPMRASISFFALEKNLGTETPRGRAQQHHNCARCVSSSQSVTIQGRAWPTTSPTTSSPHSHEATNRFTAATTDDLSQDGDFDLSALCTTATRLTCPQQCDNTERNITFIAHTSPVHQDPLENWRDGTASTLGHVPELGRTPE